MSEAKRDPQFQRFLDMALGPVFCKDAGAWLESPAGKEWDRADTELKARQSAGMKESWRRRKALAGQRRRPK